MRWRGSFSTVGVGVVLLVTGPITTGFEPGTSFANVPRPAET